MNKNKGFAFTIIIIIFIFSCYATKEGKRDFDKLANELAIAISNRDKEKTLQVANKITNEYLENYEGKKFLKMKLMALTFSGEYKIAYYEVKDGLMFFPDDYELLIAEGTLGKINNIETNSFEYAYNLLKEELKTGQNDYIILLTYYLQLIIKKDHIKFDNVNNDLKYILRYYDLLDEEELLLEPPLDFLRLIPYNMEKSDNTENRWWS